MEFPIRCFSCGAVLAHKYEKYLELVNQGKEKKDALDELKVFKYCCRRMFVSHVNIIDDIINYERKE